MNYYNENNPEAVFWLRELIKAGEIPPGDIDDRSIEEVKPHEIAKYTQQHFFAGIGGWALALRLAGWPDDQPVRTASCPCQPFSQTGKQLGFADKRHLWPVLRDLFPFGEATITFGEQVASPLGREWLAGIRTDLEGLGYEVGSADLCAAGVGAPHIRQRLYWVAHCKGERRNGSTGMQGADRRSISETGGGIGGMADSNNAIGRTTESRGDNSDGRSTGREEGASDFGGGGSIDRMEHASLDGREQRWTEPGERSIVSGRGVDGMVHPNGAGRNAGQPASASAGHGSAVEPTGGINRLGDADSSGPQGRDQRIFQCAHQWPVGTPNLVVLCEDGKARRFEPGSFPLAHGVSGRVGLLRGYGNAIVPQLAAEFICAAREAIHNT